MKSLNEPVFFKNLEDIEREFAQKLRSPREAANELKTLEDIEHELTQNGLSLTKETTRGKIARHAVNILSVVLIALMAFSAIGIFGAKALGYQIMVVETGSMSPDLPIGSLLFISPADYDMINIGDDVTFKRDDGLRVVTHRVIAKNDSEERLTTKGTANNTADEPISYSSVVGVVRRHINIIGHLFLWLNDRIGKIVGISVAAAAWFVSILFGIRKSPLKNKKTADGLYFIDLPGFSG
ncbi:MAG: signal peptidase I [Oscillospiraceae bacterium]|nr:signal peptidase I [Oscillospiraceae bacterium]